jgi:hypothetical protein
MAMQNDPIHKSWPRKNPKRVNTHPDQTFTVQTLLNVTSIIPVGNQPIVPGPVPCISEL